MVNANNAIAIGNTAASSALGDIAIGGGAIANSRSTTSAVSAVAVGRVANAVRGSVAVGALAVANPTGGDLQGGTAPGSTIKPFVGLAGLESGLRKPEDKTLSTGEFFLPGVSRGFRDSHHGGHGWVNLQESIAQSVNTYYYKLAIDMGIQRFDTYMSQYGFGKKTGIDFIKESLRMANR